MDQAGGVRSRGEGGRGRPYERDGVADQAAIGGRHALPDQRRRALTILDRWPRPGLVRRRRPGEARALGGARQRVDPGADESRRRRPSGRVDLQVAQRGADQREMVRREAAIEELAVDPAQQHALARLRDAHVRPRDDERAVASSHRPGNAHRRVARQRCEPGHLRADGVRGMEIRPADAEHVSGPASVDPVRHVLLVAEQRQATVLQVARVRRQRLPTKPSDPPQLAATAQRFVRTHRPSVAPGSVGRGAGARGSPQRAPAAP